MTDTQEQEQEVLERIARAHFEMGENEYPGAYHLLFARGALDVISRAGLTVEQGWRSWSEVPQGVLEVDAYRPDAGVFVAVFRFLSDDVESWWASESGEDLTDDLPTHFRLRPTPPQEEGR